MHLSQLETVSVTKRGVEEKTQQHVRCLVGLADLTVYVASTSRTKTFAKVYDVDDVYALESLENLTLVCDNDNDNVLNISQKIQNLAKLKTLNFHNRGDWTPFFLLDCSSLMFLPRLTVLNLADNPVAMSGLRQICQLCTLKNLTLRNCGITTLPDEFCNLRNLSHLDVSFNELVCDNLNNALKYSNVTSLNLEMCDIMRIPTVITNLRNLTYLNVSNNLMDQHSTSDVNDILSSLTKLTTLILSNNSFSSFPVQMCSLPKLENLDMEHCFLNNLPSKLYDMKSLITLNFKKNKIPLISHRITQLKKLEELNVLENRDILLPVNQLNKNPDLKVLNDEFKPMIC